MVGQSRTKRRGSQKPFRLDPDARPEAIRIGKRGTLVIPAGLRKRFGLTEGSFVLAEAGRDGIMVRPAVVLPVEIYSPERKAEFLLGNAADAQDYALAVREVRKMGLDPDRIEHFKPKGV